MERPHSHKPSFLSRRTVLGATIGSALVFFLLGIIFWGGFNTSMEATNTMSFCISCHEMKDNVYQEYTPTIHYSNRTGVRATCSDCHVPDPWVHKMVRKIQASNEVLHKILGTVNTPEKFDQHRLTMAKRVWTAMKETDSRECRNCHNFESMNPSYQQPRARRQHLNAFETGQTCIDCHKGIAHNDVRHLLSDEEIEQLEAPNPKFARAVPQHYLDGLELAATREAESERLAAEEKARQEQAIKDAVASALAGESQLDQGDREDTPAWAITNWDDVAATEITLFYPGQASMEWALNGRDHGGARPFNAGDRCVDCHAMETAAIGQKIVTGEILEPTETLIPGKRGSIPVKVQASHDAEHLFMRFEWSTTPHAPVPFVEGGKMDPDNPMKIAIMFSDDKVQYASQAGCWGTCHHDSIGMPDAPEDALVHKYLTESRSEIEIAGRRGKKRGGWDKMKDDASLQLEMESGHYMDLIRFKAGEQISEVGHILSDRIMDGGQKADFHAQQLGNKWIVLLRRKLTSDLPGDVSMALDQVYNFGFAIHDDHSNSRFHHVSLGYRLGFASSDSTIDIKVTRR